MKIVFIRQPLQGGFWKPVCFCLRRDKKVIVYWLGLKLSVNY